jgi:hypothetical protein
VRQFAEALAEARGEEEEAWEALPMPMTPHHTPLTEAQILEWAEAHRARTGWWPAAHSGPVEGVPGQTWQSVNQALVRGNRGLPGGSSLSQLLALRRGGRGRPKAEALTVEQILGWADRHRCRTGRWPSHAAGPVLDAPGLTWAAVNTGLVKGYRGLPGGSSLARLLSERRGRPRRSAGRPLTVAQILGWAERHRRRTGRWPRADSGPVPDAPGENWGAINLALWKGHRGLPPRLSLARLFREHRRGAGRRAPEE